MGGAIPAPVASYRAKPCHIVRLWGTFKDEVAKSELEQKRVLKNIFIQKIVLESEMLKETTCSVYQMTN